MGGFINTNTINSHFKKIAKDADIRVVYKDIKAYYVNNDDVFNIILGNTL